MNEKYFDEWTLFLELERRKVARKNDVVRLSTKFDGELWWISAVALNLHNNLIDNNRNNDLLVDKEKKHRSDGENVEKRKRNISLKNIQNLFRDPEILIYFFYNMQCSIKHRRCQWTPRGARKVYALTHTSALKFAHKQPTNLVWAEEKKAVHGAHGTTPCLRLCCLVITNIVVLVLLPRNVEHSNRIEWLFLYISMLWENVSIKWWLAIAFHCSYHFAISKHQK